MKRFLSWLTLVGCYLLFSLINMLDLLLLSFISDLVTSLPAFLKFLTILIGGTFILGIAIAPLWYGIPLTVAASNSVHQSKKGTRYKVFGIFIIVITVLSFLSGDLIDVIKYIDHLIYGLAIIFVGKRDDITENSEEAFTNSVSKDTHIKNRHLESSRIAHKRNDDQKNEEYTDSAVKWSKIGTSVLISFVVIAIIVIPFACCPGLFDLVNSFSSPKETTAPVQTDSLSSEIYKTAKNTPKPTQTPIATIFEMQKGSITQQEIWDKAWDNVYNKPPIITTRVSVSAECADYNHVGNEWSANFSLTHGDTVYEPWNDDPIEFEWESGDTVIIKSTFMDKDDAYTDKATKTDTITLDIENFSGDNIYEFRHTVTVVEGNGEYAGNSAHWDVTYRFKLLSIER